MEFGECPVARAEGAILAHSIALPGGRLRKGKLLVPTDLHRLSQAGIMSVTVARLAPGDVAEDAAALRVAQALVPAPEAVGLELRAVGTGRVNIHAREAGILRVAVARVNALNATDPMITVATAAEWARMAPGQMAATVKIISYAVPAPMLDRAAAAGGGALALQPVLLRRLALIRTRVAAPSGAEGEKGLNAVRLRVQRLGARIEQDIPVAHRIEDLAVALQQAAGAEAILILTGSATSDPRDVGPAALQRAGGMLLHFGMPVDPGNLLFLGQLDTVPVIGLPGCARSPALNGADWIMERVICGAPVSGDDIARLGVGGLLKEIPTRPRPREPRHD